MSNQYDDAARGGFSYEEKLALVAQGGMDPTEIGLKSADEAKTKLLGDMTDEERLKKAKLGTDLIMELGEVPVKLRAQWALQDLKIQPNDTDKTSWIETWAEEHKNDHLIQSRIRCGQVSAVMELLCKDTVLGIVTLMEQGAKAIKEKYEQQLKFEAETAAATDKEKQQSPLASPRPDSVSPEQS